MNPKKPYKGRDKSKTSYISWMSQNAKLLEKCSGQWVMIDSTQGIILKRRTFKQIMKIKQDPKARRHAYIFHVPSKDELQRSNF